MSLRRFAQTNNATGSPRPSMPAPMSPSPMSPNSPISPSPGARRQSAGIGMSSASTPTTPRTRIQYSPTVSPSLSASQPFDWEAARLRKPPPFGSPLHSARVRALRKSETGPGLRGSPGSPGGKKTVRKRSWKERLEAMPSNVMFELSLFPHNLPLPSAKTSARLVAGFMHFMHMCIRITHWRRLTDEEMPWADYYDEHRGTSWFDWTTLTTAALLLLSLFLASRYLTRTKPYNMHLRTDPLSSPHATVVSASLNLNLTPDPTRSSWFSYVRRATRWVWRQVSVSWRFVWGMKMPPVGVPYMNGNGFGGMYDANGDRIERYQQLNVWTPDEMDSHIVVAYSPVHALIWSATTGSNWILMMAIMTIVSIQTHLLISSYERLVKDKAIIAAEVMHEYDEKFVNPRVHPVRKDASVMTHQSEMVNLWE